MVTNKISFIASTQALYNAITTKDDNALYFITDTQRIYKGSQDITQTIYPVTNFPATGVMNKLYIHTNTYEIKVFTQQGWKDVSPGYVTSAADMKVTDNKGKLITSEAAIDYVSEVLSARSQSLFENAEFDAENGNLSFLNSDGDTLKTVPLDGVAHDPKFDSTNLRITIPQYGKDDLVIDLPRDNFLTDAYYDPNYNFEDSTVGPAIVLVVKTDGSDNDKRIPIPAAAMTNDYTSENSNNIKMLISDEHSIRANLIVHPDTNQGQIMLYNADRSKVNVCNITLNNDADSDMGESNNSVPTAAVIANAIKTAVDALANTLLSEGNPDEVVISTRNGIVRSGVKIGGDSLASDPNNYTLATEKAVQEAISWKTLS